MIIYKTTTFDAAHRLKCHDHCGRIHGHTWKVEVWIDGNPQHNVNWGMLFDFRELTEITQTFDHGLMLEHDDMKDVQNMDIFELPYAPSCENLVGWFLANLTAVLNRRDVDWMVVRCRVWESETSYAEDEIYGEEEKE